MRKTRVLVILLVFMSVSCSSYRLEVVAEEVPSLADSLKHYVESFQTAYDSCIEKDSFLYFSDPHLLGYNSTFSQTEQHRFDASFGTMRALYDYLPLEFVLCGGDWINNRDTQDAAKRKLLYADARMKQWFSPYYKMMGNHDYNYQGVISFSNSCRGDLPYDFINGTYYSDEGKSYYMIEGDNTKFFILDTGIDWVTLIDDYRKEQLEWLAEQLRANEDKHIVIGMHIFYNGKVENNNPMPMSKEVLGLCVAFNKREVYESNVLNSDFRDSKGKVHFILCGHNHVDFEYLESAVPCIGITQLMTNNCPSYDLCLVDYDSGILKMIRVGSGADRQVQFAEL